MIYSPDIADRYDFIVNQYESKKKWLEDLQVIINERAEVEIAYSKNLVKVANLCEKYSTKNNLEKGVASIVMSVRSVILTQSEQSFQYGQQLKTDVINGLKNGIKKQQDDLKTLQQKVVFLKNELNKYISDLERQKQEYYKNYKVTKRNKDQVLALQLQETNPIVIAMNDNHKLFQQNQAILEQSVFKYNLFLDQYFTEIAQTNKVQDLMEDFRIEAIKDSFMKILIYQISAQKNVEYDSNQVSKKIENYVREDPKPIFIELQERMMLSKLNFANYISYVETECSYPHIDKLISKSEPSTFEQYKLNQNKVEVNKTLKRFNEMFGEKKYHSQNSLNSPSKLNGDSMISKSQENNLNNNSNTQNNFYKNLLEGIFIRQEYLQNTSIKKFKDKIDQSERELILFTISLHEFSMTDILIKKEHFHEKAITDLIFLVIHVFDKIEQTKESDLVERCVFSFFKICKTYINDQEKQKIFIESLQQHRILSIKDFWVQDCCKKINQAIQRDYGKMQIPKQRQAEYIIKQEIPKWKLLQFSQQFQLAILNEVAQNYRLEQDKILFYSNVILDIEKIIKKPIFAESSQQSAYKRESVQGQQKQEGLQQNEQLNKEVNQEQNINEQKIEQNQNSNNINENDIQKEQIQKQEQNQSNQQQENNINQDEINNNEKEINNQL